MKNSSSFAAGSSDNASLSLIGNGYNTNIIMNNNSIFSAFQNMMFGVAVIIFVWMNVQNMVA